MFSGLFAYTFGQMFLGGKKSVGLHTYSVNTPFILLMAEIRRSPPPGMYEIL